jgi:hypothetical protein
MPDFDPHVFTLGEFFRGWGVTISATNVGRYQAARGHTLTFTVTHGDGTTETIADPYNYVIQGAADAADGDQITVTYVEVRRVCFSTPGARRAGSGQMAGDPVSTCGRTVC